MLINLSEYLKKKGQLSGVTGLLIKLNVPKIKMH
jgi:hypothetical protein